MKDGLLDIDHLMVSVPDAQSAGRAFEKLGFTVTPLSTMPGLANRLVCFPDTDFEGGVCNYIELMGLTNVAAAPAPVPELLSRRNGPVSTVLAAGNARISRDQLAERGMQLGPPIELQRQWHLPNGETLALAFAVAIPQLDQSPFYWNFCQHRTPHHYVRSDFTTHANTITRLSAVIAVHEDPVEAARHYERMWQSAPEGADPATIAIGAVKLEIYGPQRFAERFATPLRPPGLAGLRLQARDPRHARSVIEDRGTRTAGHRDGFLIPAEFAAETLLIVEPA